MEVSLDKDGVLTISAETELEQYALRRWCDGFPFENIDTSESSILVKYEVL